MFRRGASVLFATYFGGSRVGIFTSIAGGVVGWWAFLLPHVGFFPIKIAGELELLTYAVACALIIWVPTAIAGLRSGSVRRRDYACWRLRSLHIV